MSDHWGTPDFVFDCIMSLTGLSGRTMHDPCPYLGKDGLNRNVGWGRYNFVNPPFSNPLPWIARAQEEIHLGNGTVMVLPAFTDRKWWIGDGGLQERMHYDRQIRVMHIGRVKYVPLEGQKQSSPRFGSCLVTFNIPNEPELLISLLANTRRRNAQNAKKANH